jgi:hypothetical protein
MANVAPPGLATFTYPTSVLVNGVPTIVQLPAAGYRLFTYDAGTTNPRTTWSNAGETVANANPIILDANGQAQIFYRGNYKLELRQPVAIGGAVLWTVDNFNVPDPSASTSIQFANGTAATPSIRFAQATSSGLFSPAANVVAMSVSGLETMRWAAGNVGIGGTPTQKLDVFGTARIQGTTTITTGGLAITAGGATITAGGLTVAAGGAAITGNSTVGGTFGVTGNTTISGGTFASRGFTDNATAAAWNIDSSGRLRNNGNTQISFAARRITSDQTTSGTLVFQDVSFAGGHNDGSAYNTSTGIFTVPAGAGGSYDVFACGEAYNTGAVADWTIDLRVNSSAIFTQSKRTDANVTDGWSFAATLKLSAGDTVNLNATPLSASLYIRTGAAFSIRQVG